MKPVLFSPTDTVFSTNGIGILSDAISYRIVRELNGQYEVELKYPVNGILFSDIKQRSILLAKVDPANKLYPFRVYRINKISTGAVMIRAHPLAYDAKGIPVAPFSATGIVAALNGLVSNSVVECPFVFTTDLSSSETFKVDVPSSLWTSLGKSKGGILDIYGGEYEFDAYNINLWSRLGKDRGVSISYGKNLTSLEQDENCADCYTGVYPYWTKSDGTLVQLSEKIVNASGQYDHTKILPVDFSTEWKEPPTEDQLRARANKYIADNDIGKPVVSWKVEFVQLEQTEEYKGKAILEQVFLGDTVTVDFAQMNVSVTARVVAVDYDVILERYNSVTLGSVRTNIASTVYAQGVQMKTTAKSEAARAVNSQTPEDVFNYLTDYGRIQGIYVEGDRWYINAEVAKVINLIADHLKSTYEDADGFVSELDASSARIVLLYDGKRTFSINNSYKNSAQVEFTEYDAQGILKYAAYMNAAQLSMGGSKVDEMMYFGVDRNGLTPYLTLPRDDRKILSWKDNGDGTSTLIGK